MENVSFSIVFLAQSTGMEDSFKTRNPFAYKACSVWIRGFLYINDYLHKSNRVFENTKMGKDGRKH